MKAVVLMLATIGAAGGGSGCTYHAAIGGMGNLQTDGTTASERVPKAHLALLAGAGPCLRWPRLRTSFTVDGAIRGASASTLGAAEMMWIFNEGAARSGPGVTRTSLAMKGRLAGGWNWITDRWIAEVGVGVAVVGDTERSRQTLLPSNQYTGDFHALAVDVLATYAPDRQGADEAWLGAQLSFHFNGLSAPPPPVGGTRVRGKGRYGTLRPDQATDCNSGHLP